MISTSLLAILFALPIAGFAQTQFQKLPNPLGGVGVHTTGDAIDKISTIITIIAVPFVTIMIMYAGFTYITAYGNPEKIKAANKRAMWTLIGTFLLFGATTIGSLIIKTVQKVTTEGINQSDPTSDPGSANTNQTPPTNQTTTTNTTTSALVINPQSTKGNLTYSDNGLSHANLSISYFVVTPPTNNDNLKVSIYLAKNTETQVSATGSRLILEKNFTIYPTSIKVNDLTIDGFGTGISASQIASIGQATGINVKDESFKLFAVTKLSSGKEFSLLLPTQPLTDWPGYTQSPTTTQNSTTPLVFPIMYTTSKGTYRLEKVADGATHSKVYIYDIATNELIHIVGPSTTDMERLVKEAKEYLDSL